MPLMALVKRVFQGNLKNSSPPKWKKKMKIAMPRCFPNPDKIIKESDKKAFAKLFGEYLQVENVLQNYDEFVSLQALQNVDVNDEKALEAFKVEHHLNEDDFEELKSIKIPDERKIQDYCSTYNDIRDWLWCKKMLMKKRNPVSIGAMWCSKLIFYSLKKSILIVF